VNAGGLGRPKVAKGRSEKKREDEEEDIYV
jgi:hypothetical protein